MRKVEADQYPISVRMIMSIYTGILQRSRDHAKGYTENMLTTLKKYVSIINQLQLHLPEPQINIPIYVLNHFCHTL